ncbi:hypothetical protein [Pontibacillus yanchengensis]|uniref:Uncharacterized protein n=1 Tax=Pontibacillus yanchengensis Y32 TaxID=1385514 RepID=A0A0A2T6A3_9BACI|nr:hypothetical protein [Pontibacillus yanchengensis]KGP71029.1 hypothetical protein N782_01770 [Pontibacillus yanchengensis Y32]
MLDANIEFDEIIHKEVIKDGVFVFYINDNGLFGGYIKLTNKGWDWERGGGVTSSLNPDRGYNWQGLNLVDSDFMIKYGVITDNSIMGIKHAYKDRLAKLVTTKKDFRLWFLMSEESESPKVEPIYKDQ